MSHLLGEEVLFKEHQCKGQGAPFCMWEGRLLSDWEEPVYKEFINNKDLPILKELEQTYEKLLHETNNLSMVMKMDHELTDAVVKGNSVETILDIVEKQIMKPVVVEDLIDQVTFVKGMTNDEYEPIKKEFQHYLRKAGCIQNTTEIQHSHYTRLVSPIYLQGKIVAYCSFLYEGEHKFNYEMDSMIIGRVSTVCSLILLNEKVKLESTERMKGYFLEEIMNGKYQSEQEIMSKAFFIDLDFTGGYHAIHLKYKVSTKQNTLNPSFHNEIFEYVTKYMSDKGIHVLIGQKTEQFIVTFTSKTIGREKSRACHLSFYVFS